MIDFNVSPYYDDYDPAKGFYKILFRPGYAVQARELTQLQTLLQNQITRFGDHIFKDGSVVLPGGTFTTPVAYIKVLSTDVAAFENTIITGGSSGAQGRVISYANNVEDGVCKIYFTYTNGLVFTKNEIVTNDNNASVTIINEDEYLGTGTAFSINDSVFYVNGHFVFCESQTAIVGTDDAPVSARIGLLATEDIVTPVDDDSLLDPARGTFNFSAPGANRYTITLTIKSFPYSLSDVDTENASEDFIELARYLDGKAVYVNRLPVYSELENTLARRTYDESGDYTVTAFSLKVEDHIKNDNTKLSLRVEPGKAYVKGYEFETIAATYIDLNKARETKLNNSFPVSINYGTYFYVYNPAGSVDYTSNPTANIYNNTNYAVANVIGTARIKHITYDSSVSANDVYRLYVDNISLLGSNSLASVRGIGTGTALASLDYHSNIDITQYDGNTVTLGTADSPAYIVSLPKAYVANTVISETVYTSLKTITGVAFTTNATAATAIVTTSAPHTFISGLDGEDYLIQVTAKTGGSTIPVGFRLDPDFINVTVDSDTQITITYSGGYSANSSWTASVTCPTVVRDASGFKLKATAAGTFIVANTHNNIALWSNEIADVSLQKSDVYKLNSVKIYDYFGNVYSYDGYYDLDTGQTDVAYDHGRAYLKTGYTSPALDYSNVAATIQPAGKNSNIANVQFTFDYFTHSGEGPITVDSYLLSGSPIEYSQIPSYTSPSGKLYNLRNCFDFRPRRADGNSTFTSGLFGAPDTVLFTDFYNYLGRKARLVLTKERKFAVIDGIASETPAVPLDVPDAMSLYLVNIPPYTLNKEEVTFQYIDNRRYTMRDIGRIERRVEKLEYYTSLSLLEKQAQDENIVDPVTTIDRFKNGILVDSFAGHSVGDVNNPDYSCSIDFENRLLRPRFSPQSFNFKYNAGTNVSKRGDLLLVDHTTDTFLSQPLASSWINLNPYNVFAWNGAIKLDPATDTWVDTVSRPDVTVNLNGENDVYTQLVPNVDNPASVGVRWNDWQTVVNGTPQIQNNISTSTSVSTQTTNNQVLETTTTTTTNQQTTTVDTTLSRVGLEISTGATRTVTRDIGSRIVDTSIVPFIRTRLVTYSATGLKPLTKVRAYFDGVDVTDYCFPALQVNINGNIPEGAKKIRLSSNASVIGNVLSARPGYVFVKMTEGLLYSGNTVQFLNEAGSTVGTTATANSIIFTTDTEDITGNVVLSTNEFGDMAGTFLVPNTNQIKFRTGEKEFRITDILGKEATTAAATKYVAQGMSQSTERTIVATRIASVAVKPVQDFQTIRDTTTQTIVSSTSITKDITPPPPPPPPLPPRIPCNGQINGSGRRGRFTYELDYGTDIGSCGINYNAFTIPDRYTIYWNGNEYTTGFAGSSTYNSALQAQGFPNVVGMGSGQLRFNKTLASPRTATLVVDAPLEGTAWRYTIACPTANTAPTPTVSPTYNFSFSASPGEVIFSTDELRGTTTTPTRNVRLTVAANDVDSPAKLVTYTFSIVSGDGTLSTNTVTAQARSAIAPGTNNGSWVDSSLVSTRASVELEISYPAGRFTQFATDVQCVAEWFESPGVSTGVTRTLTRTVTYRAQSPAAPQIDPVAQTFFVNAEQDPDGIFIDSIDLYFKDKSQGAPVTVQIRPTVNGYPSSRDILPFGAVTLLPSQVNVSETGETPTNFKFESPVYLAPGEYSFVALCNSSEYTIYTAVLGDFLINDPNTRVTAQPAIGSLFKSQNASTWTPVQEEDVKFKINKCVFNTDTVGEVTLDTDIPSTYGTVEYDVFYASGETIDFANTDIEYYYKTTDTSNSVDGYVEYQAGSNVALNERKHVRSTNPSDLQMKLRLSTTDKNISPVIDLNRLSSVLVQNIINNDSAGEDSFAGGNAVAKYVTRKVTLAPGFESTDLKAIMLVNKPTGTDIKVYYKVAPVYDPLFEDNDWQLMDLESSGTSETGFVEYKYKTPGDTALSTGDRFKVFALKIVMLSSNPAKVPQIRDLRVIAIDE